MADIIEKYRDIYEKLKDNPTIQLVRNRNRYPREHGHRVTGLRDHAIEKIVEQREKKVVGNNGEPSGYEEVSKSLKDQSK